MRFNLSRLAVLFSVSVLALLLAGCADQEARSDASDAKKTADTLKGEVVKLQQEVASLKEQVGGFRTSLEQQINEKMDGIAKNLTGIEDKLRTDFTAESTKNSESYRSLLKDADLRMNQRLDSYLKQDLAQEFQKMRDEIEKNRQDLIGFTDRQLKELYPYAYQPRRLEDAGQPQVNP